MEIVLDRPGRGPLDLTAHHENLAFSTAAVGGFGGATLVLPGPIGRWKRDLPFLSTLRVTEDTRVLWEGLVEDLAFTLDSVTVQAFGLRRRLEQQSVQRIWSRRLWSYTGRIAEVANQLTWDLGAFEITDPTRNGVRLRASAANNIGGGNTCTSERSPVTLVRIMGTHKAFLANGSGPPTWRGFIESSGDGTTWSTDFGPSSAANPENSYTVNHTFGATNPVMFRFRDDIAGGQPVTTLNDYMTWENLRVLGTSLTEDAAGGFYGGSILRDLVGLVPDLTVGVIETGSDFTIENIERSVRSSALSVVDEVASYYGRVWGVWEDGRFDWKTVDRDSPQWLLSIPDLTELQLRATLDNLVRTVYLTYIDATTTLSKDVTAASTDQRNPYVKRGKTKDATAQANFLMTATSAQQLATKLVQDQGGFPVVAGRIVLPARTLVANAIGAAKPAYAIRAGETVTVTDLPKSEPLRAGRDGETLFQIASCEVNMQEGKVTIEVEGYQRQSDVLLARLAAATRTVAG